MVAGARDVVLRLVEPTFDRTQTVHVVDETGRPVHGARVGLGSDGFREVPFVSTGPDGDAVLRGLPDLPVAWDVAPPADRADLLVTRTQAAFPDGAPIIAQLARGWRVTGHVVSPRGASLGRVRVRFTRRIDDDDPPASSWYWVDVDPATGAFVRTLDPADWGPGPTYAVAVGGPANGPATHRSSHVEVGPEGTEVVLVLEPVPPAGR